MKTSISLLLIIVVLLSPTQVVGDNQAPKSSQECVILLHGLARSASSMDTLAARLANENYAVANVDYPSREATIAELAQIAVSDGLERCNTLSANGVVHFVTHSLGGILVRQYLNTETITQLSRVVMLGPPNKGSQVVDELKALPGFSFVNGPAGGELGTEATSTPNRLGPVDFELGIIAGTETINPILSSLLPNPDDGKVSVENTKIDGMSDFIEVPASHPFLMSNNRVIDYTLRFLATGRFRSDLP